MVPMDSRCPPLSVDPVVIFQIVVQFEEVERKLDGSRSKHLERGNEW